MRRQILALGSAFLLGLSAPAFAAPGAGNAGSGSATSANTGTPNAFGQPNQSCETTPNTPGDAFFAPGSAFNPFGIAGTVYAGEQPRNSRNPASVSQYDVACANQP